MMTISDNDVIFLLMMMHDIFVADDEWWRWWFWSWWWWWCRYWCQLDMDSEQAWSPHPTKKKHELETCAKQVKTNLFCSFLNVPRRLPFTNGNRINKENKDTENGNDWVMLMMLKLEVTSCMPRSYRFRTRDLRWMMPLPHSSSSSQNNVGN